LINGISRGKSLILPPNFVIVGSAMGVLISVDPKATIAGIADGNEGPTGYGYAGAVVAVGLKTRIHQNVGRLAL